MKFSLTTTFEYIMSNTNCYIYILTEMFIQIILLCLFPSQIFEIDLHFSEDLFYVNIENIFLKLLLFKMIML